VRGKIFSNFDFMIDVNKQSIIKIIITEDNENWRKGLRGVLDEHNIKTVAEAANGLELQDKLKTFSPDVILLDLHMPVMDGNETMHWLTKNHPEKKVIILSLYDEKFLMEDFLNRGAKGFLSKDKALGNGSELAQAIRKVYRGGIAKNPAREVKSVEFTLRQKEIINLIGEGKTDGEIAKELGLTPSGVDKQRKKIMNLLGAENRAKLYSHIFRMGLNFFRKPQSTSQNNGFDS